MWLAAGSLTLVLQLKKGLPQTSVDVYCDASQLFSGRTGVYVSLYTEKNGTGAMQFWVSQAASPPMLQTAACD